MTQWYCTVVQYIKYYTTDIGYCDVDTDSDANVVSRMYQILKF